MSYDSDNPDHPGASPAYTGEEPEVRTEADLEANGAEDPVEIKGNGDQPESPHLGEYYEPGSATKPSPGFETV